MALPTLTRRHVLSRTLVPALAWAYAPAFARARPAPAGAPPLLLATEAPLDADPAGFLVSEKYDGVRTFWDGAALRFRSGLPIAAPAWFVARLPALPLDGELWLGRGRFESLSGAVRRSAPVDSEWRSLHYMVFELPGGAGDFAQRARRIEALAQRLGWEALVAVEQGPVTSRQALQRRLDEVVSAGGEGLVLHRADAPYETGRSGALLKLKPQQDAEAQVVGHVAGRGRHAGRLGALRLRGEDGTEFLVGTGYTDADRETPPPVGAWVTYRYRGRTDAGVPRFASFLRLRDGGV
jgi:DNA ligase-1